VQHSPQSRPLDPLAIALTVALCLIWGFNQVAVKLAIHDIPPLIQCVIRSVVATVLVLAWTQFRDIPLFKRDGTLLAAVWPTIGRGTLAMYQKQRTPGSV